MRYDKTNLDFSLKKRVQLLNIRYISKLKFESGMFFAKGGYCFHQGSYSKWSRCSNSNYLGLIRNSSGPGYHLFCFQQKIPCIIQKSLSRRSQPNARRIPLEQNHSYGIFQIPDLLA